MSGNGGILWALGAVYLYIYPSNIIRICSYIKRLEKQKEFPRNRNPDGLALGWSTFYLEITGRDELSYTDAAQVKGLAEVGGGQQVVFASVTF
jgi:hypothetical protein